MQQLFVFCIGSFGYTAIELLWRGHSHWTMALTGGFCLWMIYLLNIHAPGIPFFLRVTFSSGIITLSEFCVGCIVNLKLGWAVWDYSAQPLNLLGQICPLYCLFWFLLSVPLCYLIQRFLL